MGLMDLANPLTFYSTIADYTGIGPAVFKSNLNRDDIDAINNYFIATPAKTPQAIEIASHFRDWYNKLDTLSGFSDSSYAEAKKFRDDFNAANATTASEVWANENIHQTGLTREEMYGLKSGQKSLGDSIVSAVKWIGVGAAGTGVVYVLYKVFKPW